MKEEQIATWFFGLNEMISQNSLSNVKIMTNSGFVVKKLKLKLIQKLKDVLEMDEKNEEKESKTDNLSKVPTIKKDFIMVTQIQKYLKTNPLGLDQLSFAKILLLYVKLFEVKLEDLPNND